MASSIAAPTSPNDLDAHDAIPSGAAQPSVAVGYALSFAMVAAAGILAFVVDHIIDAPNLSLVFVLPVIAAAASFGWGPALMAALLSVAVFDFFFIEPKFTFVVASPNDVWALGLLLVVAAAVSSVAAQSRGRAVAARRAAEQAEALHALAHAIIKSESPDALIRTAADSLGRIFDAPAVILAEQGGTLSLAASTRAASLTAPDHEAAQWALANDKPTRAEVYPFDQAKFDFWPMATTADGRFVLGVKFTGRPEGRPADPDRFAELVTGYLAAAPAKTPPRRR